MKLTRHQLEAIGELAISRGLKTATPIINSIQKKAGPIGEQLSDQMHRANEASVSSAINAFIGELLAGDDLFLEKRPR